jgi:hypothetical protein
MALPTSHELAWLAGFFDGEGCVSIARRPDEKLGTVEAQITQRIKEPPEIVRNWFGGSLTDAKTPSDCYRWRARGTNALRFYEATLPFLIVKRKQTTLLLEYASTLLKRPGLRVLQEVWQHREHLAVLIAQDKRQ